MFSLNAGSVSDGRWQMQRSVRGSTPVCALRPIAGECEGPRRLSQMKFVARVGARVPAHVRYTLLALASTRIALALIGVGSRTLLMPLVCMSWSTQFFALLLVSL